MAVNKKSFALMEAEPWKLTAAYWPSALGAMGPQYPRGPSWSAQR